MSIRCEIVSQDRIVFQGDADMVLLPVRTGRWAFCRTMRPS